MPIIEGAWHPANCPFHTTPEQEAEHYANVKAEAAKLETVINKRAKELSNAAKLKETQS